MAQCLGRRDRANSAGIWEEVGSSILRALGIPVAVWPQPWPTALQPALVDLSSCSLATGRIPAGTLRAAREEPHREASTPTALHTVSG